jgi:sodium transport system ATP-binding protein
MIEARGLHRRFGEVVAVDEVSFTAKDGAVTGLLGPNGAGKTTTLRMLYTLVRPDRGQVLVDGLRPEDDPAAARRRLGVLPDAHGLYPRLSARENVRYFGELQGLAGPELERRIDGLVDLLHMKDFADRRASGFSQGERMKVGIARAIIHGPNNLLLDEPTNGLDVMSTRAMREVIRRLKDEGRCIVLSSHVMQEVSALCDQMVIVSRGRVVATGSPDEIRKQTGEEDLEEAFVKLVGQEAAVR